MYISLFTYEHYFWAGVFTTPIIVLDYSYVSICILHRFTICSLIHQRSTLN